jgi:hypothetical protein
MQETHTVHAATRRMPLLSIRNVLSGCCDGNVAMLNEGQKYVLLHFLVPIIIQISALTSADKVQRKVFNGSNPQHSCESVPSVLAQAGKQDG